MCIVSIEVTTKYHGRHTEQDHTHTTPMPHPPPSKSKYLCGGAIAGSPEGGGWGPMRPVVRSWPAPRLIPLVERRVEGRMVGGRGTGEGEKNYHKDY